MADLMAVVSAPYYWLVCDHCDKRENSEFSAWSTADDAIQMAEDSDWVITDDGRHYCFNCGLHVCRECGTFDETELAGERDYLCTSCWEKLPEEERV